MTQNDIISDVLGFINQSQVKDTQDETFNALALKLFEYQFALNAPLRDFAKMRSKTPRTVTSWTDIPAIPITALKKCLLSCVTPNTSGRSFMTSGTTQSGLRGQSYHPTLEVYDASMRCNFSSRVMQENARLQMGIIFPSSEALPNSSLAHYLQLAMTHFGTPESRGFITSDGIEFETLYAALRRAEKMGEPYALLGASFSLVHVMDDMKRRGLKFTLPQGSRILDTGGFKGQSRDLSLDAFYDGLSIAFGIPKSQCINMYGMTELSTQFYDCGNAVSPSEKSGPHWIRTRVVNPLTGEVVKKGDVGVLAHTDLAHFNVAVSILTEDAGIETDDGFVLLGRAAGSDAQGCSLAVDEFLKATSGVAAPL